MKKEELLLALQNALSGMPRAELEITLQYYREMIEDRMEEGMSEEAAVADVGDPVELAEAIRSKPVKRTAVGTPEAEKARRPMSRGASVVLTVCAIAMAVFGALLVGDGAVRAAAIFNGGSGSMKEYTFANNAISALEIESGSAEVELIPAAGGVCRVECPEGAGQEYKVWVNDGTLHVEHERRFQLFSFSLSENTVRVYLPDCDYQSLWVKTSSGGVSVPEGFRFRTAIIDASSGGISFASDVTEEMNIKASSGGVSLSGASPDSLFVSNSSGGVTLSRMSPGSVDLHLSSGSLRLENIRCGVDLSAESSSGSFRFRDVIAGGKLTLECSSGSVKLDDCDAAELHIQCTSGSVSGHLLTPKVYSASATSGSVRVPSNVSGGLCEVRTTSGSIHFE